MRRLIKKIETILKNKDLTEDQSENIQNVIRGLNEFNKL